jgi:hypothetical protein
MTIENIKLKPPRIFTHEADFGTSAARYLWQKMINNQAFVEKCFPIGYVLYFYASQTDANNVPVTAPNPEIWGLLDGHTVNDADSMLHGVVLPDLRGYFLKGGAIQGLTGGQSTINISHSHGGQTGVTDDRQPDVQASYGGGYNTGCPHYHAMSGAWSSTENIIPPYVSMQMYIRIK